MRLYELCRDPANPARTCKGVGCKCRGAFRFLTETSWRPPGPGEAAVVCPGCGAVSIAARQPVTVWLKCVLCGKERPMRGTSWFRTTLWRLFGRREGYNS